MRAWIKKQYREHPWLTIAVSVYLTLSAVELVRILLYDRPQSHAAGVYPWEHAPLPAEGTAAGPAEGTAAGPATGLRGTDNVIAGLPGGELTAGVITRASGEPALEPDLAWRWLERERPPAGPLGAPTLPFRWTRDEAYLLEPVMGPVLVVPLYLARPDMPGPEVPVRVVLEETPSGDLVLGDFALDRNGWYAATWYLPPLLGEPAWSEAMAGWEEAAEAQRQAEAMQRRNWFVRWFHGWQELKPWHPPPGPPSVWLHVEVGDTFVPAELLEDNDDHRRLGVGIGDLAWRSELPTDGFGFYPRETAPEGFGFRWTRLRASLPLEVDGGGVSFRLRADHPDIATRPVVPRIFWQATEIHSLSMDDTGWHDVVLPAPAAPGRRGVLTIIVDRTWSPAEASVSTDPRHLGVAMTDIAWR